MNFEKPILLTGGLVLSILLTFQFFNQGKKERKLILTIGTPDNNIYSNRKYCPTLSSLTSLPKSCQTKQKQSKKEERSTSNYLIPLYEAAGHAGPSAQTNGFRHVLLAAKQLNYSILLTDFLRHTHDDLSETRTVPVGLRMDVSEICKFVNVGYGSKFKKFTNWTTEDQLQNVKLNKILILYKKDVTENVKSPVFNYINSFTNFFTNFTRKKDRKLIKSQKYHLKPKFPEENLKTDFQKMGIFSKQLSKSSTKKHPNNSRPNQSVGAGYGIGIGNPHLWLFKDFFQLIDKGGTYRGFGHDPINSDSKAPNYTIQTAEQELSTDYLLVKEMYKKTRHPKFIKNLADEFIEKNLDGAKNFVGLHWRFNENDFLPNSLPPNALDNLDYFLRRQIVLPRYRVPLLKKANLSMEMIIEILKSINEPMYFYEKFLEHLSSNLALDSNFQNLTIFIASPPSIAEKFNKIKILNTNISDPLKGPKLITSQDTFSFLAEKAKDCQIIEQYFGEVLSTFEKEILIWSKIFYRSRPSNWSFNVQAQRFANFEWEELVFDRVVYDVFSKRL